MRMIRLLALAAPLALLLPLSAQADNWPKGMKQKFMTDCVQAASQSIDKNAAQQHCSCGASKLSENFTTAELNKLMDAKTLPSEALRKKAGEVIQSCKAA